MAAGFGGAITRLWVEFGATTDKLEAGVKKSKTLGDQVTRDWSKVGKDVAHVGTQMTKWVSGPLILGGAAALKLAVDFESAFAGVTKTVNGTAPQLERIRQGIIDMSKEVPATTTEIAAVAEAAGQLGVQTDNVLSFTRTMIDLGETTDLSAGVAADALARLANITQMPQSEFDRLGSTVVALGNNLAATETEIVTMAMRLAGAGDQIGLTEAQILGFAGALSSVGIEAEAGGTAFSRIMIEIAQAVRTGNDNLDVFARVAGMTGEQFKEAFGADAGGTIIGFVEGLGKLSDAGGNVFGVLERLGLADIRVRDALLRAAGAGDLFRESLELGSEAWAENTALAEEAEKRYETTAAQLKVALNVFVDGVRKWGEELAPVLRAGGESLAVLGGAVGTVADGFEHLPSVLKIAAGGFVGVTVAAGPLLFVGGKIVQNWKTIAAVARGSVAALSAFKLGLQGIETGFGGASANKLGVFARNLGPVGVAGGLAAVTGALVIGSIAIDNWQRKKEEAKRRVQEFTDALRADSGALGENTRAHIENDLQSKNQLDDLGRLNAFMSSGRSAIDVLTEAIFGNIEAQKEFRRGLLESGEVRITKEFDTEEARQAFVETGAIVDRSQNRIILGNIGLVESFQKLTDEQAKSQEQLAGLEGRERTAAEVSRDLAAAKTELADLQASGSASQDELAASTARVSALQQEQAAIDQRLASATDDVGGAASGAADDFLELGDAVDEAIEKIFGADRSMRAASAALGDLEDAQRELAEARADEAGTGPAATAAARRHTEALEGEADAAQAVRDAEKQLARAREELASFDSGADAEIRGLERQLIDDREVTNEDEAAQKDLDLLRHDRDSADERQRLQEAVADAERGVTDAIENQADAHQRTQEAADERARVQAEAADRIIDAEANVASALEDAARAMLEMKDEAGGTNAELDGMIERLLGLAELVAPDSDLLRGLRDLFTVRAVDLFGPNGVGAASAGTGSGAGAAFLAAFGEIFGGEFDDGGRLPGPVGAPRLYRGHGGETVLPTHKPGWAAMASAHDAWMAGMAATAGPAGAGARAADLERGGFDGGRSIQYDGRITVIANEMPTEAALDVINRKQGRRVARLGRR
jgi:TP901 family phage tail tape measure protein